MPDSQNRRIVINLEQPPGTANNQNSYSPEPQENRTSNAKRSGGSKILLIVASILLLIGVCVGVWFYLQWSSLQKSPSYSLALLIDAAKRDDQKAIDQYMDTNAVVDSFLPQIQGKARERYERGLPPEKVKQAEQMLIPLMPEIKEAARTEIPRIIKEKSGSLPGGVSPAAVAFGINRVAEVSESGDTATVKTNLQNRPIELTMKRAQEGNWQIVGLKDETLADKIANAVGQSIMREANRKSGKSSAQKIDPSTMEELRRSIEQQLQ